MIEPRPLQDRVILVEELAPTTTPNGLYLPDPAKTYVATVIAVGPGKRDTLGSLIPMELKVGDRVSYSQYGASEITVAGNKTKYIITKEENIIAVLEETENGEV